MCLTALMLLLTADEVDRVLLCLVMECSNIKGRRNCITDLLSGAARACHTEPHVPGVPADSTVRRDMRLVGVVEQGAHGHQARQGLPVSKIHLRNRLV